MIEQIKECKRCDLCRNQLPLLDNSSECDVMWVGLSAKIVDNDQEIGPLDESSNTGKVIASIENELDNIKFYKTNVVKCVPLNDAGKIRYPFKDEMENCLINLQTEIDCLEPRVVFLLGGLVKEAVERNYKVKFEKSDSQFQYKPIELNNILYYAIEHPSYIWIYKRRHIDEYKKAVIDLILNEVTTKI